MCTDPITHNTNDGVVTFACRQCDECISTRKNGWVARAMAEKATSGETIALDLTYRNNEDGTLPAGAKAFRYADVAGFLKRLREDCHREYKARGEIRFIVAGERGSKRDRVHWHMIIFATRPFSHLGKWSDFLFKPLAGPQISQMRRKAKMIHWSLWPHGHLVVKEPDEGGMQYVLKYAMKDQFNIVKSKGSKRFTKADNHGASYFRMSKHPPIGQRYLEQRCDSWEERLVVPTKLELKVPDYRGYWWPKGPQREYLVNRLHQINETRKQNRGQDCPQWNTLLTSLVDDEKTWEGLFYGEPEQITDEFDKWEWDERLGTSEAAIRRRCGGARVCRQCWHGFPRERRTDFRAWYHQQVTAYVTDTTAPTGYSLDDWCRDKRQINPFCTLGDTDDREQA